MPKKLDIESGLYGKSVLYLRYNTCPLYFQKFIIMHVKIAEHFHLLLIWSFLVGYPIFLIFQSYDFDSANENSV